MLEFYDTIVEQNETDPSELLILAYTIDLLQQTAPEKVDPIMLERFHMLSCSGAMEEMSESEKGEFMKYCRSIEARVSKPYVETADSYLRLRLEMDKKKN